MSKLNSLQQEVLIRRIKRAREGPENMDAHPNPEQPSSPPNSASNFGRMVQVTHQKSQGGREYMEDEMNIEYHKWASVDDGDKIQFSWAFFGIFDGHGGGEAAVYAREHLVRFITSHKNFDSDDDQLVLNAIKEGFIRLHREMEPERTNWPKQRDGHPSNAGTTASVVFIKNSKLYIANVGDSSVVLGYEPPPKTLVWKAEQLTADHKPDSIPEYNRIKSHGGNMRRDKHNEARVVWNKPLPSEKGSQDPPTFQQVPFLNMARSLGDFWSYNPITEKYVVSPVPDTRLISLDPSVHRCIVLASDGLWDALGIDEVVHTVYTAEKNNSLMKSKPGVEAQDAAADFPLKTMNPAEILVKNALDEWGNYNKQADNISVIVVVFH